MSTAKLEKVNSLNNFLPHTHARTDARTHAHTHIHTPVCARLICFCLLCRPNAAKSSSVHLQGHWQEFDNFATCLQMVPTFPLRIELACCLLRWLWVLLHVCAGNVSLVMGCLASTDRRTIPDSEAFFEKYALGKKIGEGEGPVPIQCFCWFVLCCC